MFKNKKEIQSKDVPCLAVLVKIMFFHQNDERKKSLDCICSVLLTDQKTKEVK